MRERFREDITGHRLRREIIATKLANRLVNRLGPVNPFELAERKASRWRRWPGFAAAERLLDLPATWALLDSAPMAEDVRLMLFERARRCAAMSPTCCAGKGEERPGVLVARLAGGVEALTRDIADLLHAEARAIAAHRGGTGRSGRRRRGGARAPSDRHGRRDRACRTGGGQRIDAAALTAPSPTWASGWG
jgi:glutamate dehydrogenase